jgi:hypothetical protein
MLKKGNSTSTHYSRAETRAFPEVRSRLVNILNVPAGKERILVRLGWGGGMGTPAV